MRPGPRPSKDELVVAPRSGRRRRRDRANDPPLGAGAAGGLLFQCADGRCARVRLWSGSAADQRWHLPRRGNGWSPFLIGCGGWSKRRTLFGSDHQTNRDDTELNPAQDSARIRAFFVHPDWARRGVAQAILSECESAIDAAGFRSIELAATLPGVPFYAAFGYALGERTEVPLGNGLTLGVVRMTKSLDATSISL